MFQLFDSRNIFDRSPFQYARMDYLRERVGENYKKLVDQRRWTTGRLDSSHLLRSILLGLAVEFKGDLQQYIQAVGAAERRVVPTLNLTSSYSRGRLFTEGVFYNDCPEIIIAAPSFDWTVMDLWKDYRKLSAVTVLSHPITDIDVVELGVMNNFTVNKRLDLAIIAIDIPLLAAQWQLWRAGNPDGTPEHFLTEVPLVGAVKSHLNIAFFNKVRAAMGIIPYIKARTNLTFQQFPADGPANDLAATVVKNITSKAMHENQILSSIPVIFGDNYLDSVRFPDVMTSFQIAWADQAFKMDPASVVLECMKYVGDSRLLDVLKIIRRTLIQNEEAKTLTTGLTTAASALLMDRLTGLVVSRLPNPLGVEEPTA
jgi:hypothetical protein